MIYLPADTVKEKVAALRTCLPGVNLYNFLKGMPTALGRSKETVPRGLSQLKEVSHRTPSWFRHYLQVAQLPVSGNRYTRCSVCCWCVSTCFFRFASLERP